MATFPRPLHSRSPLLISVALLLGLAVGSLARETGEALARCESKGRTVEACRLIILGR